MIFKLKFGLFFFRGFGVKKFKSQFSPILITFKKENNIILKKKNMWEKICEIVFVNFNKYDNIINKI